MLDIEKNQNRTTHLYGSLRILPETDPGWENDTRKQNAFSPQVFPGAEAFPHYY